MRNILYVALASLVLLVTSACSNLQAQPFTSAKTEVFSVKKSLHKSVSVAPFTSEQRAETSIMCRGGGITVALPESQTFPHYLEDGMKQMLIEADRYDPESKRVIQGQLKKIDVDTLTGNWAFSGTFSLGSKTVSLDKDYPFPTAFAGELACQNAANAFSIAAAHFISDVLRSLSKG